MQMNHKQLKLGLLLFFISGAAILQAQTLLIKQDNDTGKRYELDNIQKLTFSEGNLTINKTDNTNYAFDISTISYLSFADMSTDIDSPDNYANNVRMQVFPNPFSDELNVDLKAIDNPSGTVSIISLVGKVLINKRIDCKDNITINLSHLSKGIYLCRYNSDTNAITKTIKITKQ